MCRNIKTLFNFDPPVTNDEVHAASLQFVRKITGFNKPSKTNEEAFLAAVEEVAAVLVAALTDKRTTGKRLAAKASCPAAGPCSCSGRRRLPPW